MTFRAGLLASSALIALALPAQAQTYVDVRNHLSTSTSTQDQVCDLERTSGTPQCIPFALSDSVAHTFKALPGFIAAPCLPIELFGGDPTGVAYNDAAWTAVTAAIGTSNGCVRFGFGTYKFASQIAFTLSGTTLNGFAIEGAGSPATRLYWPNAAGGISLALNSDRNSFRVSHLNLLTGVAGGGTAISATNSVCNGDVDSSTVEDVEAEGIDKRGTPAAGNFYWNTVLNTVGVSQLNVDVLVAHFDGFQHGVGINFAGDSTRSCYAVVNNVTRSSFFGGAAGYVYGTWAQGVTLSHDNFTNGAIGVLVPSSTANGYQLEVGGGQFNTSSDQISIGSDISSVAIHDNQFFIAGGHAGVSIANGLGFMIHDNMFDYGATFGGAGSRQGVAVSGNDANSAGTIHGNVYSNIDIGNGFASGTSGWNVQSNGYKRVTTHNVNSAGGANTIGGGSD